MSDPIWDTAFEAWSPDLLQHIPGLDTVALSPQDLVWMGQKVPGFLDRVGREAVDGPSETLLADLEAQFADQAKRAGPTRWHLRLGLVSFRLGAGPVLPVADSRDVLRIISMPNPRVAGVLAKMLREDRPANLFLRPWLDLPGWGEFRSFWRGGRVIGVTQMRPNLYWPEIAARETEIRTALQALFRDIGPDLHMDPVVVDALITEGAEGLTAHLGELNPFLHRTHPGLFDWTKPEQFDGRFRFNRSEGAARLSA